MTTPTQRKTQFISHENGEFRMRLYSYEYVEKGGASYRIDSLENVTPSKLATIPVSYRIDNLFSRLQTFCF